MRTSLFLLCFTIPLVADDWPQFHGPTRTGTSSEKGILREWPKEGPKVLWKHKAGAGWAGAVVAEKRAYLFHRVKNEEVLDCLDLETGKVLWSVGAVTKYRDEFNFDEGPRSTPLLLKESIITLGANGDLIARDLKAGKELWKRNINEEYEVPKGFFGVATSPIVVGNVLMINVGGKGAGVVAFDPKTGKEVWKRTDDGVSYSSPVVAKFDSEINEVGVFFTRAGLLVIEPNRGATRYSFPWRPRLNASVNAASPIVVGSEVWISTSYSTGAVLLDLKKDKEPDPIWKNDESISSHYNTPVYKDGYLYGVDGRQEGTPKLRCVDWKTGKVKWTQDKFGCATIISVDGVMLAMQESGELVMFEPNTEKYKELARHSILESPTRAAPALSNGIVIARDGKTWVAVKVGK